MPNRGCSQAEVRMIPLRVQSSAVSPVFVTLTGLISETLRTGNQGMKQVDNNILFTYWIQNETHLDALVCFVFTQLSRGL